MLPTTPLLLLALAAAPAIADIPAGYTPVYLTSKVNSAFVIVPKAVKAGSGVVVQTGTKSPAQQWYIKTGNVTGSIQLANSTLCLDAGAKTNWKDLATISVGTCSATAPGQAWVVQTDGRISLAASSPQECVDLQYSRATANNPVGIYSCGGLGGIGARDTGINWPPVNVTA